LETWETTQHLLIDTGKPRKTCVEVEKPVSKDVTSLADDPATSHQ